MGWRYVEYRDRTGAVAFSIDPVVAGKDTVYVPDPASWRLRAPAALRDRRDEVLSRLKSLRWKRELEWVAAGGFGSAEPIPGSLSSTVGGAEFEAKNFFAPESPLSADEARMIWLRLEERFAEQARGKVTILVGKERNPNGILEAVSIPTLRKNPNVTLDIREVGPSASTAREPSVDRLVEESRIADAVRGVILAYVRQRGVKAPEKEGIAALAAVIGERSQEAAAEFPVRRHKFVPGQRVFSVVKVNALLAGDGRTADVKLIPDSTVYGQLRTLVDPARFSADRFPPLEEVFKSFASGIGNPEDWGKVPLSLPREAWPRLLPLRVAFDTRAQIDAALQPIKGDKERGVRVCTRALAQLLNDAGGAVDPRMALTLALETINGMAKTAPMLELVEVPTEAMREAQHQVVVVGDR
jgi:hypothetical protein